MGCQSEVILGDNLTFSVTTHTPATGALTDADAVPAYRLYEDETDPPILTGVMAKLDDDDTTGFYTELVAATTGNGFEQGKSYNIYITAAVGAITGAVTYGFTIKLLSVDEIVESTLSLGDEVSTVLAAAGGKTGAADPETFRNVADDTDRLVNVTAAGGIRTAQTIDVSDK